MKIDDAAHYLVINNLMGSNFIKKASITDDYKKSPDAALYTACKALLEKDEETLMKAATVVGHYGLTHRLKKFADKLKKETTPVFEYAYKKQLPYNTPELAKKSERIFNRYYTRFPIEERANIASKLVSKTAGFATKIYSSKLERLDKLDLVKVAQNEMKRAYDLSNRNNLTSTNLLSDLHKKAYEGVSLILRKNPNREELIKLAHTLETIDRSCGLADYKSFSDTPLGRILVLKKKAADTTVMLGSGTYNIKDIQDLPVNLLKKAIGYELAVKVKGASSTDAALLIEKLDSMTRSILDKYIRGSI